MCEGQWAGSVSKVFGIEVWQPKFKIGENRLPKAALWPLHVHYAIYMWHTAYAHTHNKMNYSKSEKYTVVNLLMS